jgi:hypothetical protein
MWLWVILKTILWILLSVVLMLLLLLAFVVFMPIVYETNIKKEEYLHIKANVNLFYFIRMDYSMHEEMMQTRIFLFGKELKKRKKKVENVKQELSKKAKEVKQEVQEEVKEEVMEEIKKEIPKARKETTLTEPSSIKQIDTKSKEDTSDGLEDKKTSIGQWKRLWEEPFRKEFIQEVVYVLKVWGRLILPKLCAFHFKIGLEYPDQTGKLLAGLSLLYPYYYRYGHIEGSFDQKGIWGEVQLEGKLSIARFLRPIVRSLFKKPVRKYIQTLMRVWREDEEYGI